MNGDIEEMNRLIDVLLDQVEASSGDTQKKAVAALDAWQSCKLLEHLGLGDIRGMHRYRRAYETLAGLGFEVGGMLEPMPEKFA